MTVPPEVIALLLGPTGLTIFLIYVCKRLWDSHDRSDADVIGQRNALATDLRSATSSVGQLASAVEQINRDYRGRA